MNKLFEITDCCGNHIKFVNLEVDPDIEEFDLEYHYYGSVLEAGNIEFRRCDSCYDYAYKVKVADNDNY